LDITQTMAVIGHVAHVYPPPDQNGDYSLSPVARERKGDYAPPTAAHNQQQSSPGLVPSHRQESPTTMLPKSHYGSDSLRSVHNIVHPMEPELLPPVTIPRIASLHGPRRVFLRKLWITKTCSGIRCARNNNGDKTYECVSNCCNPPSVGSRYSTTFASATTVARTRNTVI